MLVPLVRWSAVLCFIATLAVLLHPSACARVLTAVAAAYVEMGWLFLQNFCVAAACVACCRWLLQTVSNGSCRILSASSKSFCHYVKSAGHTFQGQVTSHFSKATAFANHTLMKLNAMRQLTALLWFLTVYPLTLFAEVGFFLLTCSPVIAFCLTKGLCGGSSQ